jgi:hypothetical protein
MGCVAIYPNRSAETAIMRLLQLQNVRNFDRRECRFRNRAQTAKIALTEGNAFDDFAAHFALLSQIC